MACQGVQLEYTGTKYPRLRDKMMSLPAMCRMVDIDYQQARNKKRKGWGINDIIDEVGSSCRDPAVVNYNRVMLRRVGEDLL